MAVLQLPDFRDSNCFYMEACGKLRDAKHIEEPSKQVAKVRLPGGDVYLRLLRGGKPKGHLHIDLARQRYFRTRPQVTADRKAIERGVSEHLGKPIDVVVFGQFVLMMEEIPSGAGVVFAGPSAVVSTIDNAAIEVGGAHLIVRNDRFVRTIDWQFYRDDSVLVDILARCETEVSLTYLKQIHERLEGAFATYILGRTTDASSQS